MEHLKGRTFAIIDVETSGTSAYNSRIIEIGILRIEDGVCVETFKTCVNPEHEVPLWILGLTGITQSELDEAPIFGDVIDEIARLLDGAIFVAHNVGFDYGFVQAEFARHGRQFSCSRLCSVRLSRILSPRARGHSLSSVIERHGFACESRHRAYDDAHVIWQLLQWAHKKNGKKLRSAVDLLTKKGESSVKYTRALEHAGEVVVY